MANKKIRIRLKAYEHRTLDTAAVTVFYCLLLFSSDTFR